jgi:hypothetical protein
MRVVHGVARNGVIAVVQPFGVARVLERTLVHLVDELQLPPRPHSFLPQLEPRLLPQETLPPAGFAGTFTTTRTIIERSLWERDRFLLKNGFVLIGFRRLHIFEFAMLVPRRNC